MPNAKLDPYFREVSLAAMRFQHIEECLKMCLANCFGIIRLGLNGKVAFNLTYKDVENLPLGPLINEFKKYTTNSVLLKNLRGLPKKRNYIAHNAYLLTVDEQHNSEAITKEIKKVAEISRQARQVLQELFEESRGIEEFRTRLQNTKSGKG